MRKRFIKFGYIFVIVCGLYLVLYPFVPNILFFLRLNNVELFPYTTNLEEGILGREDKRFENKDIPDENRIVIPTISVDLPIVEGGSENVLNLGIWHRPDTGYPGSGNMVLTGHRVGYAFLPEDIKNSTSFYHLDKLKDGDYVIIYWNGVEYDYQIYGSIIVENSDMSIEDQNETERLTLYTCHPVGSTKDRLVYFAHRIETSEQNT